MLISPEPQDVKQMGETSGENFVGTSSFFFFFSYFFLRPVLQDESRCQSAIFVGGKSRCEFVVFLK